MYIRTMTTTTENEALYDMDGNCICKLEGCAACNPVQDCPLCDGDCGSVENCPSHCCTGDNCYCIGGDENSDREWDDSIVDSLKEAC